MREVEGRGGVGGKNERWREEGWEEKMREMEGRKGGAGEGGEAEEGGENDTSNLV